MSFGTGFANAFNAGNKEYEDRKNMVLANAFEMIQRNQVAYRQAQLQDNAYRASAMSLVKGLPGVPVSAWPEAYSALRAGASFEDVRKQMMMNQYSGGAQTAPTTAGNPGSDGSAPAAGGVDSQMQASGMGGKPPQPTIDPAFQNGQADTGLNANAPPAPTGAPTDQSANSATDAPQTADPSTAPATAPVGTTGVAPTTAINNQNTHPATYNPVADPNPTIDNTGLPTGSTAPPPNPIQAIGDKLALVGKSVFDPQARKQLQDENNKALFDYAKGQISSSTGLSSDQIDQMNAGFVPPPTPDSAPVTGVNPSLDPATAATMLNNTQKVRMEAMQKKSDAIDAVNQLYDLDTFAKNNPDVLTTAGAGASALNDIASEIQGYGKLAASFIQQNPNASLEEVENSVTDTIAKDMNTSSVGKLASAYQAFSAKLIRVAYAQAKVMTGGGGQSLSDKDFSRTFNALVNSHNYASFSANTRGIAQSTIDKVDSDNAALLGSADVQGLKGTSFYPTLQDNHAALSKSSQYQNDPALRWAGMTPQQSIDMDNSWRVAAGPPPLAINQNTGNMAKPAKQVSADTGVLDATSIPQIEAQYGIKIPAAAKGKPYSFQIIKGRKVLHIDD